MAILPKEADWIEDIDGVNVGDPVAGGESGPVNLRLASLAKRTEWLKAQLLETASELTAMSALVGGINVATMLQKSKNLSDVANKSVALETLGGATKDHTHDGVYLKKELSLGDVPDPAAARSAISAAAADHTHEQYCPYIIGEYKLMSHSSMGEGWAKAIGALYDPKKYPKAFAIFGTKHGGDGVNTFGVPDWRGDGVRINDDARGVDSGRVLGSEQEDAIKAHEHEYRDRYMREANTNAVAEANKEYNITHNLFGSGSSDWDNRYFYFIDSTTESTGGNETRMRNRSCCMYVYIGRPGIDA